MEENPVELFDYFRVIWKRKILIIVLILVCIGIGVGVEVMNSKSKPPPVTSYIATAVVKIGQKVSLGINTIGLAPMELPEILEESIPLQYGGKVKENSGYHLDVKRIGATSMIRLTLKGSDIGVERVLKETVDMLVDEHRKKAKTSAAAYTSLIIKLEADARMVQENIAVIEASIIQMKTKEKMFIEHVDVTEEKIIEEKDVGDLSVTKNIGDLSVIWNMLYLKTIDKQIDLSESRKELRNIQWQLLMHRTTIGNPEKLNTELIGEIKQSTIVEQKVKSAITTITVAGVAGLIMSLFIVFFMEYIEESKSRLMRKKN